MSIRKQFLKNEPVCKLSFRVTKDQAQDAETIKIVGDFNEWNKDVEPMKKLKSGDFTQTIKLGVGSEYQFRYFINDTTWSNEVEADKTAPTGIVAGEVNSVIEL